MDEIFGFLALIMISGLLVMAGYGLGRSDVREDCASGKIIIVKDKPYTCSVRELK